MRRQDRRRSAVVTAAVAVFAAAVAAALAATAFAGGGNGVTNGDEGHQHYTIGLFGDVPYGPAGRAEYPNLIADMNDTKLTFSIFDGDLKNGSERCDDSLYTTSRDLFNTFVAPVVVLPGDNDWTDCHRANNGSYDPLERLAYERSVFYTSDQSLGSSTLTVLRQRAYPENVRWRLGPVVYIGLNVQGSNDNFPHAGVDGEARPAAEIAREDAEHLAREAANVQWLRDGFAYAESFGAKGVLVAWQGDPNFNNEQKLQPASYDGYTTIVGTLREQTLAFSGQVVLVHGDSHYFKIDKPLNSPSGSVLANFTRLETFGSANTHWVAADVDANDPNVFTFRPMLVPQNVG
jgi:hypothetical protein